MKHLTTVDRIGNRLPHSALGSFISLEYLLPTDKNRSWRSRFFLAPCSSIWWVFKITSPPNSQKRRHVVWFYIQMHATNSLLSQEYSSQKLSSSRY